MKKTKKITEKQVDLIEVVEAVEIIEVVETPIDEVKKKLKEIETLLNSRPNDRVRTGLLMDQTELQLLLKTL